MSGMGQTFKAPVQAINRMKSNANLHLPSGLGTIRTWLHIGAWLAFMTPRRSKASTCSLIAVCISMLWCPGGSRLRETSHFPLSTTILIGSTLADWCLTLIEKTTMYFSQSFLGFAWNPTESWPITLIESRCSDNRDDQMGYLAIRCHHHRRWNPAHYLFFDEIVCLK